MLVKPARSNLPGLPSRHNRRRLRSRIVLSFFLLGLGLSTLIAVATLYFRNRIDHDVMDAALQKNNDLYADGFYQHPNGIAGVAFEKIQGKVFSKEKFDHAPPAWQSLPNGVFDIVEPAPGTGEKSYYKLAVRKDPNYWFFMAYDTHDEHEAQLRLNRWILASIGVFSIFALVIGIWSASRVMSPVSDLVRLIRRRSGEGANAKALAPRFPNDEVGELARALDDYSDRINDAARREREFNADVSHELRTPLAVIRSTVELMLEQPDLGDKMRERIQRIQRAQEGGTAITETLLLLSRGERVRGETSVARVAEQLLDAHRLQQRRGKQLDLRMEGNTALMVDAPEATVNVALGNLIANAVRYTDTGSVTVHIGVNSVDVIDTGRGLSQEDEQRMAERGYRGGASGNTKGAGIGLAIVTRICALYGWQMQVQPRRDGTIGTVATLDFSDVR
ncbi:MAG: HAMP domain-containing histidine kinase [Proteobacteria bacterium]|nr:HAMP domain-containing histidine kinase [Pseudomonadota bacterium]